MPTVSRVVPAAAVVAALLLATVAVDSQSPGWTIRARAMQSPLPVGACTAIEVIVRDATGATPTRPGGMQISWQEFEFAITSGASAFAWRNNDPRSHFLCATAPGATATITISYPGAHVPAAQRIAGVRASQVVEVTSAAAPTRAGTAGPGTPAPPTPRTPSRPADAPPGDVDPAVRKAFDLSPVVIEQGDFSDILSMIFLTFRPLDAASVVIDSPLELRARAADTLRFTRKLATRDTWMADITIAKGQRYTPSRADLSRAGNTGSIFGVVIDHARSGPTVTSTVRYFVPDRAPLVAHRRETRARLLMARVFDALLPPVYAQGADWAGSTATSITQRVVEQGAKTWSEHRAEFTQYTGIPTTDGPRVQGVLDAKSKYDLASKYGSIGYETASMLLALDALRKCAENPTNLLTQREYSKNPGEKQKVLDGIDEASSEVAANAAVRVVNALTGQAAGAIEISGAAAGMAVSEAFSQIEERNDSALKEASQSVVDAANGSVVGCGEKIDPEPALIPLEPLTVEIAYQYNRFTSGCNQSGCGATQEFREATGQALIEPLSGAGRYHELRGGGTVKWQSGVLSSGATAPYRARGQSCGGFPWTSKEALQGVMTGRVEGTRVPGKFSRLKLTMSGHDLQRTEQQLRTINRDRDGKIECEPEVVSEARSDTGAGFSFQCEFPYVDLISGGTFATFSNEKDRGYGTCTVTLARASGR